MKLPAAERTAVINALSYPYGRAELKCDGHTVVAVVERSSTRAVSYQVLVYVNGFIRGQMLKCDDQLGAKFYPTHTRSAYSAAEKKKAQIRLGKRAAQRLLNIDGKYQFRSPFFRTGRAFLQHIEKHNESIELISPKPEAAAP